MKFFLIVFVMTTCCVKSGMSQSTFEQVAQKYPRDTEFFIYCQDFQKFAAQATELAFFRALINSPLKSETNLYVDAANRHSNEQGNSEVFDSRFSLTDFIQVFFRGEFEYARVRIDNRPQWALKVGLEPSNPATKWLANSLTNPHGFGPLRYRPFSDEKEFLGTILRVEAIPEFKGIAGELIIDTKQLEDWPELMFVAWTSQEVWISSSEELLRSVSSRQTTRATSNSLSTNRKFQELCYRIEAEKAKKEHLLFYVDLSPMWENYLSNLPSGEASEKFVDSGFHEILSYGGRVALSDPNYELDVKMYTGLAVPKIGICKLLEHRPLTSPVNSNVRSDVDLYIKANFNIDELNSFVSFCVTANLIGNPLGDRLLACVTDYLVTIGPACRMEAADSLSGETDFSCWFFDHPRLKSVNFIFRNYLKPDRTAISSLIESYPGMNESFAEQVVEGQRFWGLPTHQAELMRQQMEERFRFDSGYERNFSPPDFSPFLFERSENESRYLAMIVGREHFHSHVRKNGDTLDQSPFVNELWSDLTKSSAPHVFVYFQDALFRDVFHYFGGMASTSNDLLGANLENPVELAALQKRFDVNADQFEILKHRAETADQWSRAKFKSHFKPAAAGVYPTEKGYLIRILQLR